MNLLKSLALAASVAATTVVSAQDAAPAAVSAESAPAVAVTPVETAPATDENSSLLGKRYVAADFTVVDWNDSDGEFLDAGLSVNLPATANLDAKIGVSRGWLRQDSDFYATQFDVSATYYIERGAFRPYAGAQLGHMDVDYPGPFTNDYGFFAVAVGTEYLINAKLSANGGISYGDSFESGDNSQWIASATLNYWLLPRLVIRGQLGWREYGDVAYGLGAAWVF